MHIYINYIYIIVCICIVYICGYIYIYIYIYCVNITKIHRHSDRSFQVLQYICIYKMYKAMETELSH